MILTFDAPDDWFGANHRMHFAVRARLTKAWREAARDAAWLLPSMPFYMEPVILRATVHKPTRRIYDPPNLLGGSVKAAIDGLVDAGVLAGDDSRFIVETRIRAGEVRKPSQLVLEVNPA